MLRRSAMGTPEREGDNSLWEEVTVSRGLNDEGPPWKISGRAVGRGRQVPGQVGKDSESG